MHLLQEDAPAEAVEAPKALTFTQPASDNVLLEDLPGVIKSAGGIDLPVNMTKFERRGRVIAVGPGAWGPKGERLPMWVKVGDIVSMHPHQWLVVDEYTTPHGLVSERHIYGKCD